MESKKNYKRYHIETKQASNIKPHPHRFKVKVKKLQLAKLLIKELLHYRKNLEVVTSRPCLYGVFSGPIGGFAPREHLCVGCLRCTTQYPEMCTILPNPDSKLQGDEYFKSEYINTIIHESETGRVPIRGQGYRGKFGGKGWDGMWTDMSEIVRPTRDGIHGREYISTEVDIGEKTNFVSFDDKHMPINTGEKTVSIPIPFIFDTLPKTLLSNETACKILAESAKQLDTFAILPVEVIQQFSLKNSSIIPLVNSQNFHQISHSQCPFVEMSEWDDVLFNNICQQLPNALPVLRTAYDSDLITYFKAGVRVFHLTADYHGRSKNEEFVLELIRHAHLSLVNTKIREKVTLIGSGGIIAAEHVPKAIICGLDCVALDTPLLAALQATFIGNCKSFENSHFELSPNISLNWGIQRIKNLCGAWRDQLLEILGAMGLREVRRMRGEVGRAMFQQDLENDAFSGIAGYDKR